MTVYVEAYICNQEGFCVFQETPAHSLVNCLRTCGAKTFQLKDSTNWKSEQNGTCYQCKVNVSTDWDFKNMLKGLGISSSSIIESNCKWNGYFQIPTPKDWTFSSSSDCRINGINTDCSTLGSNTVVNVTKNILRSLVETGDSSADEESSSARGQSLKNTNYTAVVELPNYASPRVPSRAENSENPRFVFDSVGCTEIGDGENQVQNVDLILPYSKEIVVEAGKFQEVFLQLKNGRIGESTQMSMHFKIGTVLRANSRIELKALNKFEVMREIFKDAKMATIGIQNKHALELLYENDTFSITFPSNTNVILDNGVQATITIDVVNVPRNIKSIPKRVAAVVYYENQVVVEETEIQFFKANAIRHTKAYNTLDIITTVFFGICLFISLYIIHWHGIPFTTTTIWTDMVAISAVLSFAAAFCAYVIWMIDPSSAFVYLSAVQYIFNATMIISLCFHWASVLSLKLFKKVTWKSPVLVYYAVANAIVVASTVVSLVYFSNKLDCVYNQNVLVCGTVENCDSHLPIANGQLVRDSITFCDMDGYYISLTAVLTVYTLLLMILGCMVLNRGRMIMMIENRDDAFGIRKSLTVFYVIISTTCVFYVSAEVLYLAQYTSKGQQLNDWIWYTIIVWLPQCLPPLMLLFLQWNPTSMQNTENAPTTAAALLDPDAETLKEVHTPDSVDSSNANMNYSKMPEYMNELHDTFLDDSTNKTRLLIRLKLPKQFNRKTCVSLAYCALKEPLMEHQKSHNGMKWTCVGTTERKQAQSSDSQTFKIPFLAVLEVPNIGLASNTILRFVSHCSTKSDDIQVDTSVSGDTLDSENVTNSESTGNAESDGESSNSILPVIVHSIDSFNVNNPPGTNAARASNIDKADRDACTISNSEDPNEDSFLPLCEFVTSLKAVMEATSSGQSLSIPGNIIDDDTQNDRSISSGTMETLLNGSVKNAVLLVQTAMVPQMTRQSVAYKKGKSLNDAKPNQKMGNIIRFFQYDAADGSSGLVVEDLQESTFANNIPRQYLEVISAARQKQYSEAKDQYSTFVSQKKVSQDRGLYGTLIGQIQDEGDTALAKEWLKKRVDSRKEYAAFIRNNIQHLVARDRSNMYFKASVDKNSDMLRFLPTNLHVQELKVGPTHAFSSEENRRYSKEIATYDFTTIGAMAAHVYKFKNGGLLSMQNRLEKLCAKVSQADISSGKWGEPVREMEDLRWEIVKRMDVCFSQALAGLVASFCRKVELALQNPDTQRGSDMLRQISTLGFLFQVESLLSTHGKEIGMLEDMAATVAQLSNVSFVLEDVTSRPTSRFSFRVPRKKDQDNDPYVVKATLSRKQRNKIVKYIIKVQVNCGNVCLPEKLASGGEVSVTPILFTQGINEMQTIANNTERGKTEIQDMININNLRPLKTYCDKYCRLALALPPAESFIEESMTGPPQLYRSTDQTPMRLSEEQVGQFYSSLQYSVIEASQSLVKSKHAEILTKASDFCRELGAGRVTVCKSAKDRTAMSVTLEQGRILNRHHNLPSTRLPATVSVMRTHGVRIENALKNTGKRMFAFNKIQRSLLPEDYRCPEGSGGGNVS